VKVLIIDDSPVSLDLAKARLASEGLDLVCADGGHAGLAAAQREMPDLILLDVDMPDMGGFDVCQQLKDHPDLDMIPIIFLTGSDAPEDKVHGLDMGAVDYVTKPFDAFELRARVRAALRTKRYQDLLARYAEIDPLTELHNRRALTERMEQEWSRIGRYGGELSLIMVDVDHFKNINDTYGHAVGDRLLREVAGILAEECRQSDVPTRYGGDEFAILCPETASEDAANLAQRCLDRIEQIVVKVQGKDVGTGASMGVAEAAGTASVSAFFEAADSALYNAKEQGRGCVSTASVQAA
jgi:two-component system cell cycle response regulator